MQHVHDLHIDPQADRSQPFNVIHPALEHLREMFAAADQVFCSSRIRSERGTYHLRFWLVALTGNPLQSVVHRPVICTVRRFVYWDFALSDMFSSFCAFLRTKSVILDGRNTVNRDLATLCSAGGLRTPS